MIYTVTFNPSLDYVVQVDDFAVGEINRTRTESIYPGGKGINVSLVLQNLGLPSVALGFTAGFSGAEIERLLQEAGCRCDFIAAKAGYSRINTKIISGAETALNGQGPQLSEAELAALFNKLRRLTQDDVLVLAGSIPASLPDNIYEQILELLQPVGTRVVVDATGDLLLKVLKYRPFLIKPNHEELGEFFGRGPLLTEEEILTAAQKLQQQGARNVLVSRGANGALLLDENGKLHKQASPKGTLVNSVGAGDSMVAGFLAGYLQTQDYDAALRLGVAAGSASAFKAWLATREDVEKILASGTTGK
ncbi:1-phosphofructokinase [uncultured Phascolarctobacterium sp.]|uniref:1-phosphofructokinase n=1 Tax=uncultured Phascolarctobacterium sp. TaxID=512296 RepID=UPI0025EAB8F7|nr:1-phosphofructokinase [uncultured Phascolarctobacterium sp.]